MNVRRLADRLAECGLCVSPQEPMAAHTTFQIGGNADLFVPLDDPAQLAALRRLCREEDVPAFLIGRGSNLLVSDSGVRGVVARLQGEFQELERLPDNRIRCGAGVTLAALCRFAAEQGLSGLEFAYGIPGTVGGAVYMNAGAYGGEMADVVLQAEHVTPGGATERCDAAELAFSYRASRYQQTQDWITFALLQLRPGDRAQIEARMREQTERRRAKQPLEYPSAGSVFRRPPGYFAGTLIESCGLKGLRVGGAEVSVKHAGFIINRGGATCADVLTLIERVRRTVLRRTGVELEPEIRTVGTFDGNE